MDRDQATGDDRTSRASFGLRALCGACLVSSILAHAQVASTDPIIGVWRTYDDRTGKPQGQIRIAQVAGQYVGSIERGEEGDDPNARCSACRDSRHNMPLMGMVLLEGLQRQPDGSYANGRILDPDTGNTWQCDIHVNPDGKSLVIHGFIGLRMFGRSQTWRREGD